VSHGTDVEAPKKVKNNSAEKFNRLAKHDAERDMDNYDNQYGSRTGSGLLKRAVAKEKMRNQGKAAVNEGIFSKGGILGPDTRNMEHSPRDYIKNRYGDDWRQNVKTRNNDKVPTHEPPPSGSSIVHQHAFWSGFKHGSGYQSGHQKKMEPKTLLNRPTRDHYRRGYHDGMGAHDAIQGKPKMSYKKGDPHSAIYNRSYDHHASIKHNIANNTWDPHADWYHNLANKINKSDDNKDVKEDVKDFNVFRRSDRFNKDINKLAQRKANNTTDVGGIENKVHNDINQNQPKPAVVKKSPNVVKPNMSVQNPAVPKTPRSPVQNAPQRPHNSPINPFRKRTTLPVG